MDENKVYAALAAVLLVVVGAIVVWRTSGDEPSSSTKPTNQTSTTLPGTPDVTTTSRADDDSNNTIEAVFARYDEIETEWDLLIRGVDAAGTPTKLPDIDDTRWNEWFSGSELSTRASQFRAWVKEPADAVGGTFKRAGARTTEPDESASDGEVLLGDCVFEARFGVVSATGLAPEGGGVSQLQYRLITLTEIDNVWRINKIERFIESDVCVLGSDPLGVPTVAWAQN
jgi:hypothetical protein